MSAWFSGSTNNIDAKICKVAQANDGTDATGTTKCIHGVNGKQKLSDWFGGTTTGWDSGKKGHEQWGEHNAKVVSKDTAELSREEKGAA